MQNQSAPNPKPATTNTRYPYTYACDYIRNLAGFGEGGTKLSRSDASRIMDGIAPAVGMNSEKLACLLADYFKANEDEITKKSISEFWQTICSQKNV